MPLYNPKSTEFSDAKVVLVGTVIPISGRSYPFWEGNLYRSFCVCFFLGLRVLLVRALTNPNLFSLQSRRFNPSQWHWSRSQRMGTGDGRQDVLLIKKKNQTLKLLKCHFLPSFESPRKRDDSVQVYNLLHIYFFKSLFTIFSGLFLRTESAVSYFRMSLGLSFKENKKGVCLFSD